MDLRLLPGASTSKLNIERLSPKSKEKEAEQLYRACQEFESVFIAYLMKSMRKTIPRSEFMNGGLREDMYLAMMDEEISRVVAKGPGMGLAASIYRQIGQNKKSKVI